MLKSDEKIAILELRNKGYGYKSIASILKVKRDDVRDFCKSKGLTGYVGYGKSMSVATKAVTGNYSKSCKLCGKKINNNDRKGRKSKFCSNECRREWWSKHPEAKANNENAMYSYTCIQCGREFSSNGTLRRYCSRKCYIERKRSGAPLK